jgi:hypothetical protein
VYDRWVAAQAPAPSLAPVGTAFIYQGYLEDGGSPADGSYSLRFELYDDPDVGSQAGSTVTKPSLPISDGYLTITLDFGIVFDGTALWLKIGVQGSGDSGFTTLAPRQPLTPVPYAISASNLGGIEAGELYTQADVDALLVEYDNRLDTLETLLASISVENDGHDVVFTDVNVHIRSGCGSTDGAVNGRGNLIVGYNEDIGSDALRGGSHNLIVGSDHNYSSYGGLVAGQSNTISGIYASVSGGRNNIASGDGASVHGGGEPESSYGNTASGVYSYISGGRGDQATGSYASIAGGVGNIASYFDSAICGGFANVASGSYSTVCGGESNEAAGSASAVSGGYQRTASGPDDWVAGSLFQDN